MEVQLLQDTSLTQQRFIIFPSLTLVYSLVSEIMDSIKYPVNAPDVLRYVNARLLYLQQRRREKEERARQIAERNSSTASSSLAYRHDH